MSVFLLTITATAPDGEVLDTETTPIDASPFYGFEKGITVLGGTVTLAITFDPPLVTALGGAPPRT